jgi:translation initiation factor 2B subunit (eIF-2B alpha/beta/delta family)
MTTQEFLVSLSGSSKLSAAHKDLLRAFMEACDLVKFAKYTPARSGIEFVSGPAGKFIEDTKEIYMNPAPFKKNDMKKARGKERG